MRESDYTVLSAALLLLQMWCFGFAHAQRFETRRDQDRYVMRMRFSSYAIIPTLEREGGVWARDYLLASSSKYRQRTSLSLIVADRSRSR